MNDGKLHQPIYKVRTFESIGSKFPVGESGNKDKKFVEADKGTNLYFAIYQNENGERSYTSIPLNEAIERLKMGWKPVPEKNEEGDQLLIVLSPDELVYVPIEGEDMSKIDPVRVYRFVSCTGNRAYFVQHYYSSAIINNENGSNNKSEKIIEYPKSLCITEGVGKPEIIKKVCMKIKLSKIGLLNQ